MSCVCLVVRASGEQVTEARKKLYMVTVKATCGANDPRSTQSSPLALQSSKGEAGTLWHSSH
jgi:hypothetical protein